MRFRGLFVFYFLFCLVPLFAADLPHQTYLVIRNTDYTQPSQPIDRFAVYLVDDKNNKAQKMYERPVGAAGYSVRDLVVTNGHTGKPLTYVLYENGALYRVTDLGVTKFGDRYTAIAEAGDGELLAVNENKYFCIFNTQGYLRSSHALPVPQKIWRIFKTSPKETLIWAEHGLYRISEGVHSAPVLLDYSDLEIILTSGLSTPQFTKNHDLVAAHGLVYADEFAWMIAVIKDNRSFPAKHSLEAILFNFKNKTIDSTINFGYLNQPVTIFDIDKKTKDLLYRSPNGNGLMRASVSTFPTRNVSSSVGYFLKNNTFELSRLKSMGILLPSQSEVYVDFPKSGHDWFGRSKVFGSTSPLKPAYVISVPKLKIPEPSSTDDFIALMQKELLLPSDKVTTEIFAQAVASSTSLRYYLSSIREDTDRLALEKLGFKKQGLWLVPIQPTSIFDTSMQRAFAGLLSKTAATECESKLQKK